MLVGEGAKCSLIFEQERRKLANMRKTVDSLFLGSESVAIGHGI